MGGLKVVECRTPVLLGQGRVRRLLGEAKNFIVGRDIRPYIDKVTLFQDCGPAFETVEYVKSMLSPQQKRWASNASSFLNKAWDLLRYLNAVVFTKFQRPSNFVLTTASGPKTVPIKGGPAKTVASIEAQQRSAISKHLPKGKQWKPFLSIDNIMLPTTRNLPIGLGIRDHWEDTGPMNAGMLIGIPSPKLISVNSIIVGGITIKKGDKMDPNNFSDPTESYQGRTRALPPVKTDADGPGTDIKDLPNHKH
jgi:hypothetical protein